MSFPSVVDPDASDIESSWHTLSAIGTYTDLLLARNRSFAEKANEPGSGSIEIPIDDTNAIRLGHLIRMKYKGWAAFDLLLEEFERVALSSGEESDMKTTWTGRGHVALMERALTYPSQGVGHLPIEQNRVFNWTQPVFNDSGWQNANVYTTIGVQKAYVAFVTGGVLTPSSGFTDDSAGCINAYGSTVNVAVEGDVFTRQTISIPLAGPYTVEFTTDDLGEMYIDGQQILSTSNTTVATQVVTFTAGTHYVATHVHNWFPSPYFGGLNPGWSAWSMKRGGGIYLSPTATVHSDSSGKMLSMPSNPVSNSTTVAPVQVGPGMTPGAVIRVLVQEAQARGTIPYVSLAFTDYVDSAGHAWPTPADIATKVGTDLLTVLREMSATYIDFWMKPGTTTLYAWNKGGRGIVRSTSFHTPTDPNDPSTGNLIALTQKGKA
jgi:hypothetical protein